MKGRSEIRNKVIARFFKEIGFIEQWGTGIRRIISLCRENNLKHPEFYDEGTFFRVVIYKVPESAGNDNAMKILDLVREMKIIVRKDVEQLLKIKERAARMILNRTTNQGLLECLGKGKKTVYRYLSDSLFDFL